MLERFIRNRNAARGMTLVEMLVVMAIFGIVMLAVMSLFIPAVRSTAVQTQVTDVQSNLRLALNRLSMDLLTAGFLIGDDDPIIFESGTIDDPVDFTIQTRAVGSGFARVDSATSTVLTLSQPAMVDNFPDGSKVRIFESVTATEVEGVVYTITQGPGSDELTISPAAGATIPEEAVVVRIKDAAQPALQTIRYQLSDQDGDGNNDTLIRTVNGATQLLARNVSNVNFAYEYSGSGRVNKIDVALTGRTEAVGNDAIGAQKTRTLQTSVTLRNVF